MLTALLLGTLALANQGAQPEILLERDDTRILRSCRVVIPEGRVIADANGNGVVLIEQSGIVVTFARGSVLRGAPGQMPDDLLKGIGVSIKGQNAVTVRGLEVRGYKVGLEAANCKALTIEDSRFAHNFRQRLGSTREREDSGDWLAPHDNDANQWALRYGAAVSLKACQGATIRRLRIRAGQNGILLDRVTDSKVHDNDASFLSGWGMALWRSSGNVISRNALDFCVRGYSHGVYNRGQDSAGLLMFEQCCRNVIAENSITHGGDGIFVFAGKEALASSSRSGCNDNLFLGNDLSYAAAHGLELTFSFGNRVIDNRMVGNAICGLWGGYSQKTLIQGNHFEGNGQGGYGHERGGVNIEHGLANVIAHNTFQGNACGVHLWWDADEGLMRKPWAIANEKGSRDNIIAHNVFSRDAVAIHLRECVNTTTSDNRMENVKKVIDCDAGSRPGKSSIRVKRQGIGNVASSGKTNPVGARARLAGREHIVLTEWGPWDHESPLMQRVPGGTSRHDYRVTGLEKRPFDVTFTAMGGTPGIMQVVDKAWMADGSARFAIEAPGQGVFCYRVQVRQGSLGLEAGGVIVNTTWSVRVFPWQNDPRKDLSAWRRESRGTACLSTRVPNLDLRFGNGGPSQIGLSAAITKADLPPDKFGTVARCRLPLSAGIWKLTTLSDDGVRVTVSGNTVIENWSWHGPTRDSGTITLPADKTVDIEVEHFELDGYAVLALEIEPDSAK